ncbi:hypothetical protein HKD37_09G025085 [Glycine soja]
MVSPIKMAAVRLQLAAAGLPPAAGHAIFLYEGFANGRPDKLGGSDQHFIELAQDHDQSRKPQCPVGLLQVHWVSRRCDPCKLIYSIGD